MPTSAGPSAQEGTRALAGQPAQIVLAFLALTFLLTLPFWIVGTATGIELLPGLPIAAFAVVCPGGAAFIISCRPGGLAGGLALLRRALTAESA